MDEVTVNDEMANGDKVTWDELPDCDGEIIRVGENSMYGSSLVRFTYDDDFIGTMWLRDGELKKVTDAKA